MASSSISEEIKKQVDELRRYSAESKDQLVSMIASQWSSYKTDLKDSVNTAYDRVFELYYASLETTSSTLQLEELWQYRNQFIIDNSLAQRINMTLSFNIPVFLLSKGLRRIRNPVLFTTFASLLVLPELINPFNRR